MVKSQRGLEKNCYVSIYENYHDIKYIVIYQCPCLRLEIVIYDAPKTDQLVFAPPYQTNLYQLSKRL